ncbi:response regulator [Pseudoalteromonas denitrificans]|uniref:Response regulator receiver domain-containing protein n=1 Tax=Pseudoalteromonas denitrificans DSM 6059 TaxID=1123010 RepID=A0A1I1TCC5_9GAMM|nr:response regulator [Pseudoalteromonas denitrificans]SFD56239.1 Response regulator receiver domain-containing protein [Pseudoalteromonas denitrificans DSM 6059]
MTEDFLFSEEPEEELEAVEHGTWKLIIVDDESEVHAVTKLALSDFKFQDKSLEFLSAYSGKEAKELIAKHPDVAIVLLDVVMETDDAGLKVAQFIREEAKNNHARIILRTGQPGQAPERQVIVNYDINDYKSKTELTAQKLFTVVMSSLRSYRDILSIEQSRQGLEKIIIASRDIFTAHSMENFIEGVIQQLTSIIGTVDEAMYATTLVASNPAENGNENKLVVFSGQGEFEESAGKLLEDVLTGEQLKACLQSLKDKSIVYRDDYLFAYCSSECNHNSMLYISGVPKNLTPSHKHLIEIFAQNVQVAYENIQLQSEVEDTQREIVYRLGEAVEQRSSETGNHVKRVAHIACKLASLYGMSEVESEILKHAAPLHDVGKIGIPDTIIHKPKGLDSDEWDLMKSHSENGHNILKDSKRSIIKAGAILARDHHEKWDGSGYPRGTKGEDIHIYGRIVALADVYDSLRHKRCYKEAWNLEQTVCEIKNQKGLHFEPKLVDLFISNIDTFENILLVNQDG